MTYSIIVNQSYDIIHTMRGISVSASLFYDEICTSTCQLPAYHICACYKPIPTKKLRCFFPTFLLELIGILAKFEPRELVGSETPKQVVDFQHLALRHGLVMIRVMHTPNNQIISKPLKQLNTAGLSIILGSDNSCRKPGRFLKRQQKSPGPIHNTELACSYVYIRTYSKYITNTYTYVYIYICVTYIIYAYV